MDVRTDRSTVRSTRTPELAPEFRIEDVSDAERLGALEGLQARVWGSGLRDIVPVHVLHIVATTGGIVLIAYEGEVPIGFAFGFLARRDGRLYHASHMLGIDPAYQGHGIGAALKWAQRDRAIAQGLELMTWTFDPLEARNAYFNLHKLGVISRTYKENVYGELDDDLNRGLPSDRLMVEWWLRRVPRAARSSSADGVKILADVGGRPVLRLERGLDGQRLRVDAPGNVQQIKRENPSIAAEWRLAQRAALTWALERGYVVHDFARGSYILERGKERENAD
jgi:predicted GNAT superfamily acetyltransferase